MKVAIIHMNLYEKTYLYEKIHLYIFSQSIRTNAMFKMKSCILSHLLERKS